MADIQLLSSSEDEEEVDEEPAPAPAPAPAPEELPAPAADTMRATPPYREPVVGRGTGDRDGAGSSGASDEELTRLLDGLRTFLTSLGASPSVTDGWSVIVKYRANHTTAGAKASDSYYFSPEGKRFDSKPKVPR